MSPGQRLLVECSPPPARDKGRLRYKKAPSGPESAEGVINPEADLELVDNVRGDHDGVTFATTRRAARGCRGDRVIALVPAVASHVSIAHLLIPADLEAAEHIFPQVILQCASQR